MTDKKYSGLGIGIIFTIISLLLILTYIIPALSIIPGAIFESIASSLTKDNNIGKLTIILLTTTFVLATILFLIVIKKQVKETGRFSRTGIIIFMITIYFLVHPLGFYIYWWAHLDFRMDGQIMFLALDSFPYSSFAFIPLGILFDFVINKYTPTNTSQVP